MIIVLSACISELIGYAGDLGMGGFCQLGLHSMVLPMRQCIMKELGSRYEMI